MDHSLVKAIWIFRSVSHFGTFLFCIDISNYVLYIGDRCISGCACSFWSRNTHPRVFWFHVRVRLVMCWSYLLCFLLERYLDFGAVKKWRCASGSVLWSCLSGAGGLVLTATRCSPEHSFPMMQKRDDICESASLQRLEHLQHHWKPHKHFRIWLK